MSENCVLIVGQGRWALVLSDCDDVLCRGGDGDGGGGPDLGPGGDGGSPGPWNRFWSVFWNVGEGRDGLVMWRCEEEKMDCHGRVCDTSGSRLYSLAWWRDSCCVLILQIEAKMALNYS